MFGQTGKQRVLCLGKQRVLCLGKQRVLLCGQTESVVVFGQT